ncbi:hypothetical protein [Cohnella sp.]|uniref:hypothetical protein n=1 Tax=Cohnella sp. TaxID=1883426 RepID=UPI0035696C67
MKRALKVSLMFLGLLLLLLGVTCPDNDDYKAWLAERYEIFCEVGGPDQIILCNRGKNSVEWKSKHVRSLLFYMQVEDNYSEGNKVFIIRAFGIFNHFFDYSKFTVDG